MSNTVSKIINDDDLSAIIQIESAGDPKAKAKTSSASGLGQFIDATWMGVVEKHRPDLLEGRTRAQVLALRRDPSQAALNVELLARFTEDNAKALGKGYTLGDLYLAHFLGIGGAKKLLRADPSTDATSLVGAKAANANKTIIPGKTAGQVRAWAQKRMDQSRGRNWVAVHYSGAAPVTKRRASPVTVPVSPVPTVPVPVETKRTGFWDTIWRLIRGQDAKATATTEKKRPGLHPSGDPILYDQQEMLSEKGWTEVGQPDGLMGGRTANAVRAFRKANGMAGSEIDEKFATALLKSKPRQIAVTRAEATASDLRADGNTQVSIFDTIKKNSWLLTILGVGGASEAGGILDKTKETVDQAQDILGSIASAISMIVSSVQWIIQHWYLFAIGFGLFFLWKVTMGILNAVVLFKQGFLTRSDK